MKTIFLSLLTVCLGASISIFSQTITHYAGIGSGPISGDGSPAASAGIGIPGNGIFDRYGNFYFVGGYGTSRVRMVDASGIIHTIAGTASQGFSGDGGAATTAQLNSPYGVAVDTAGNIYVADYGNSRIRRIDALTHIISTIAGNGTAATSGDGGPATAASIMPYDLCLDRTGAIYLIDGGGTLVRKISTVGIITTIAGTGTLGYGGDGGPPTSAVLYLNYGIRADTADNIYLAADTRVRKINTTTNTITTIAGTGIGTYAGEGMAALSASFTTISIGINTKNNHVYIADIGNDRVYEVDASGIFHLIAGTGTIGYSGDGGGSTGAQINNPWGVTIDQCGNLYISDGNNRRIRKVTMPNSPSITVSANPGDTVCEGPVTFTSSVFSYGTSNTYQWYVNGATVSAATSAVYTYIPADGDSIRCTVTTTGTCITASGGLSASSNMIIMEVTPLVVPSISISASSTAATGSMVTVNATVAGAGSSYTIKWFKNSVLFGTTTASFVTYVKTAGTDIITAKVISSDVGCYDSTTSAPITVGPPVGLLSFPFDIAIEIHPNPVLNKLTITAEGKIDNVTITSMVGQTLISRQYSTPVAEIDVAALPPGIYLVRVNDRWVQRFVKE